MAIESDVSIATNGDIRYTGSGSNYSVLELHRFLGGLADDEQAAGDDLVDITVETPSDRSTDKIITLNDYSADGGPTFNIDDTLARHLYDGSVTQREGDEEYGGLRVLGTVVAGTEIMIVQGDRVLPPYWSTGINPDAPNAVIMRCLIKTREGGADIDCKRIIVKARELGDQFKEFPVTMGLANSVAAISTATDLNNGKSDAVLEGYTDIVVTEGFQLIDIDNDTVDEEYYSKWDKGAKTLNDTFEATKQRSQRAHITDNGTDTGDDFTVDNGTILGQAQEFTARAVDEKLVEARFKLKIGAGAPTGPLTAALFLSDDVGSGLAEPTGSVLATSEPVLASLITSSYAEVIFRFTDSYTLTAGEKYFIVIRHPDGTAGAYFAVQGDAGTGADDGNRAEDTGSWAATAADDLWFTVKSSPILFGIAGELFRGVTHEIVYDGEAGAGVSEGSELFWGTRITYDGESGSFEVGRFVKIGASATPTVAKNGGEILFDDTSGKVLYVALEDATGAGAGQLAEDDRITQIGGTTAYADATATIVDDDKGGGRGLLLAKDDNGADGDLYIQLLCGVAPVDNLRISEALNDYVVTDTTITPRTVSPEFIGATTGTNLIGAYGLGFDTNDVGSSDKFFDLTNTQRTPPNNVTFKVTGLVAGEDRVMVGPRTGSALEKGQWLLSTALTGVSEVNVVIKTGAEASPIATDTPAIGTGLLLNSRLRIQLDSGVRRIQPYASYSGSTFVIPAEDYSGGAEAAVDNEVYLAYIDCLASTDEEGFTGVYKGSDRNLRVRVRDGGGTPIKTFEGNAIFGDANSSVAATRTTDA
jgi:hypothetical protein